MLLLLLYIHSSRCDKDKHDEFALCPKLFDAEFCSETFNVYEERRQKVLIHCTCLIVRWNFYFFLLAFSRNIALQTIKKHTLYLFSKKNGYQVGCVFVGSVCDSFESFFLPKYWPNYRDACIILPWASSPKYGKLLSSASTLEMFLMILIRQPTSLFKRMQSDGRDIC